MSGGRIFFLSSIAFLVLATFASVRAIPVHHDIGWPLWVGQQVLSGAELYIDIVEVHPPLVIGVAMLAVLLGRLPLLTDVLAYHLLALGAVLVSLALCWRVLGSVLAAGVEARRHMLLVLGFVLLPFVAYGFGLEEHFMLALVLPYLLALGASTGRIEQPLPLRLVIGILAGVGFSMKPLYGPVWLALVGYLMWTRGGRVVRRVEVLAPAAVIVAYIVATVLFAPRYFGLARWASEVYFHYFPSTVAFIVFSSGMAVVVGVLALHAATKSDDVYGNVRRVLAVALVGFTAVVVMQRKGWSYHWYPVHATAIVLADCVVLAWLRSRQGAWGRTLPVFATVATVVVLVAGGLRLQSTNGHWGDLSGSPYHLPQMRAVVEQHGEGGPIVALSTVMAVGFPLVNEAQVGWASRFSCLWMLPGIYADAQRAGQPFPYNDSTEMGEIERYMIDAVAEDLEAARPTLIIVDPAPPSYRLEGFSYAEYFSRDERLRAVFSRYALLGSVGRYQIYKRFEGAAPVPLTD